MTRKIVLLLGVVLVLFLVWHFFFHKKRGASYITVSVTRGSVTSLVEATGTLEPVGTTSVDASGTVTGGITVGAQVTGRIVKIAVDFNSHVKKGQLLALIDPLTYESQVQQDQADIASQTSALSVAQVNVATAQAQLSQDEANLANVTSQKAKDEATLANDLINYNREVTLVQKNYDSVQNLDNAKYAYQAQNAVVKQDAAQIQQAKAKAQSSTLLIKVNQEQVGGAVAALNKSKARLVQDQANLSYTRIVSPVDGIVVANNAAIGQTVVASFQSPSLFVIAQSLDTMQIDTLVDEADVPKIKVGQQAHFNIDAYPNKTFTGTVYQMRQNPITQQNVVDYDVIVHVDNSQRNLLPGMTANVSFIVAHKDNVLKIPNRALLFVPPEQHQRANMNNGTGFTTASVPKKVTPHVWVLENGKLTRRKVEVGINSDSETEVLSGVDEGEQVITGMQTQQTKRNPYSTF